MKMKNLLLVMLMSLALFSCEILNPFQNPWHYGELKELQDLNRELLLRSYTSGKVLDIGIEKCYVISYYNDCEEKKRNRELKIEYLINKYGNEIEVLSEKLARYDDFYYKYEYECDTTTMVYTTFDYYYWITIEGYDDFSIKNHSNCQKSKVHYPISREEWLKLKIGDYVTFSSFYISLELPIQSSRRIYNHSEEETTQVEITPEMIEVERIIDEDLRLKGLR
jgi:hypothetical protein